MKKNIFRIFLIIVLLGSFLFVLSSEANVDTYASSEKATEEKKEIDDEVINPMGVYAQAISTLFFNFSFNILKGFDSDISSDLLSINNDIFNSDIEKVLSAKKVSFYKGIPIIKTSTNRAGTFLCIMLDYTETEETLLHEYGHTRQELLMGPLTYLIFIGIPSYFELGDKAYYSRPWEITADLFGGLARDSRLKERQPMRSLNDEIIGVSYLITLMAFGKLSYNVLYK